MSLKDGVYGPWDIGSTSDLDSSVLFEYYDMDTAVFAGEESEATRVFYVTDELHREFIDDCLGFSQMDGGKINRILPDQHPLYPALYASRAEVGPLGVPKDMQTQNSALKVPRYRFRRITVNYHSLPYDIKPDDPSEPNEAYRYVEQQIAVSGEYLTTQGKFKFLTANPAGEFPTLEQPPGVITSSWTLRLTLHEVPETSPFLCPNVNRIQANLGKVNSQVFFNNGKGTCLFVGGEAYRMRPSAFKAQVFWRLTFEFLFKQNGDGYEFDPRQEKAGHNYIFNVHCVPKKWDLVIPVTGNENPFSNQGRIYERADMYDLFTFT